METPADHAHVAAGGEMDQVEKEDEKIETAAPEADPSDSPKEDKPTKEKSGWWDFIHDQIQKAKDWAKELVDSIKGNKSDKVGD